MHHFMVDLSFLKPNLPQECWLCLSIKYSILFKKFLKILCLIRIGKFETGLQLLVITHIASLTLKKLVLLYRFKERGKDFCLK